MMAARAAGGSPMKAPTMAPASLAGQVQQAWQADFELGNAAENVFDALHCTLSARPYRDDEALAQLHAAFVQEKAAAALLAGDLSGEVAALLKTLEAGKCWRPWHFDLLLEMLRHQRQQLQQLPTSWQALHSACTAVPGIAQLCDAYATRRAAAVQAEMKMVEAAHRLAVAFRFPPPSGGLQ